LTAEHRNADDNPPRYDGDAILLPDRVDQLERDAEDAKERDKEYKDEQLKLDRRMATFTGLLVVTSLISGGISIWQATLARKSANAAKSAAETAQRTLTEIHKGGTDTHQLAESASNQVLEMKRNGNDTHFLAQAAERQAANTERLATEAKISAQTTHQALVLDQRPWVLAEHIELDHEPIFNQSFWFNGWISNSGKTPATNVLMADAVKWWDTEPEVPDFSDLSQPLPAQMVFPGVHKYDFNSHPDKMDEPRFIFFYQNEVPHHTKLYLLMKISYCDGFGNRYWTTMCVSHSYGTGLNSLRFCEHGNSVGQDRSYKSCPKQE
jgi:hypothetical protein